MKHLKNTVVITLIAVLNVLFSINVYADTKYSLAVSGASQVSKGSNITLTLTANDLANVDNGFDGYQGIIDYDSSMLTFVDATGSISGWEFKTNTNQTNKVIFLGYDKDSPNKKKTANTEIFKITFNAKTVGSTQLVFSSLKGSSSTGVPLTASPISKTITIIEASQTKSSDASLSNLSVNGYTLSPTFKPATTSYSVNVPNNVTSLDVSAITNDSNAKVSISGNKNLSVGKNNILVEVTAEDGNKKTYKIEVTRASASNTSTNTAKKSSNNNLSSVSGIDGLSFDPNKTEYEVELPFEVTSLNVSATPEDSKAKVNISNGSLKDLEIGKTNTITITVTAEDSSIKVYTFNVKRTSYKSETGLKELKVNDQDLLEKDNDTGIYNVTVPESTDKIDISAIPISEGSTVKIKGDTTLKNGNNTVVVEVTDKNGFTKSYTINVTRKSNFLLNFLKNWWLLLLVMLFILLILLLLIYLYNRNKTLLDEIEEDEQNMVNHNQMAYANAYDDNMAQTNAPIAPSYIDNNQNMVYNNNNDNVATYAYIPKHSEDDEAMQTLLGDSDVKEVSKEIKIVKNDRGDVEKEYKIIENYRKK